MTLEPHFSNIQLITRETGISENMIEYLPSLSYPCGIHNCCFHMVYSTPEGLFAVIYHCGCEYQTVPDGRMETVFVRKL